MYNYEELKSDIFTEDNQRLFLAVRDYTFKLLETAGAVRMQEIMGGPGIAGDTWLILACVDRLLELKEIAEVTNGTAGQHRVFIRLEY